MNIHEPTCGPGMKRCTKCGEVKPLIAFGVDKEKRDGLKNWCRQCACAHTALSKSRAIQHANAARKKTIRAGLGRWHR